MSTYTVASANPIPVAPSGMNSPFTLQNRGPSTVWVAQEASGNKSAAFELVPDATLGWNTNTALYAFVDNGSRAELLVVDTTVVTSTSIVKVQGPVDAEITGPVDAVITGPVTVEGTVEVGNVLQTQVTNTVTAEVANVVTVEGDVTATVTGNVNATLTGPIDADISGPVTVSSITGPVTVEGTTTALGYSSVVYRTFAPAPLNTPTLVSGLSGFATISLQWTPATGSFGWDNGTAVLIWQDSLGNTIPTFDKVTFSTSVFAVGSGQNVWTLPVRGPRVSVLFGGPVNVTSWLICGYTAALPASYTTLGSSGSDIIGGQASGSVSPALAAGNAYSWYPPSRAGRARFFFTVTSAVPTSGYVLLASTGGGEFAAQTFTTQRSFIDIVIPQRAPLFTVYNNGPTTMFGNLSITYQD